MSHLSKICCFKLKTFSYHPRLHFQHQRTIFIWTASSEFGTYRLCEQRRFRRACAFMQSRQNLRCSLIQAVTQEEPSDRKPDPWPLWMAGHAQLKLVVTECSKTHIRLTGLIWSRCKTAKFYGPFMLISYLRQSTLDRKVAIHKSNQTLRWAFGVFL